MANAPKKMRRILFVCLGNICRSPTAEAAFCTLLEARGLGDAFVVDSAGTADHHRGEEAHVETRKEAARRGVTITHRSRPVVREDFDRFDLLVAMDRKNERDLQAIARDESDFAKIVRLRSFESGGTAEGGPSNDDGEDVPDPWYTGEFARVYDICANGAEGLLRYLLA